MGLNLVCLLFAGTSAFAGTVKSLSPYDVVVPSLNGDPSPSDRVSGQLYYDVSTGKFKGIDTSGSVNTFATGTATQWTTTGSDIYYNSGRVGVGTINPSQNFSGYYGQFFIDPGPGNNVSSGLMVSNASNTDVAIALVNQATGGNFYQLISSGGASGLGQGSFTIYDVINGPRLSINSNGHVGVGTVAPQSMFDVNGGISVGSYAGNNAAPSNGIIVSGNVGIGTNAPAYALDVSGDVNSSGCVKASGSTIGGTCTSDERLKTDIRPFELGLEALLNISPKYFRFNGLAGLPASSDLELGVIAQDVEKASPKLIVTKKVKLHPSDSEATEIKQVNYGAFTYVLINSVKEFYQRWLTEGQKTQGEITQLKADNQAMKQYLCAKEATAPFCK